MNGFYRQLAGGITLAFKDLNFSHPTVRRSLKTAIASVLACFMALYLQAEQPYWAGISAFVVMQRTVGATIYKALLRIGGTVSGAVLGLILASILVEHHLILVFVVTLVAFCGIYLSSVFRRHVYAWIFLYVTALLVLVGGLENPTPQTFIHLAFYRSFEIAIGILVGLLVSNTIFVEHARKQISDALEEGFFALEALSNSFFDQLISPKASNPTEAFERQARSLMDKLFDLDELLDYAGLETGQYSKLIREQKMALGLRRMAEIMLYCYNENIVQLNDRSLSDERRQALIEIRDSLRAILPFGQKNLSVEESIDCPESEVVRLDNLIKTFEETHPSNREDRIHYIQIARCFRLLCQELAHSFFAAPAGKAVVTLNTRSFSHSFSGFYLDPYKFRFALSGAIAVLTLPFVWLYLDLPGYSQIVISIAACITLTIGSTQFKGYLRLSGCLIGAVIAFLILGLNIENLAVMLAWLFAVVFFCGLIFYGEPKISYFGMQCFLVVVVGLFGELSPVQSLGPPFERLLGIFLGVLSLIFFQKLLVPTHPIAHLQHLIRQSNQATREVCEWIFRNPDALARLDHWQNRRLFINMVSAIRELESFDEDGDVDLLELKEEGVTNYRYLLHSLYGYILAQSDNPAGKSTASEVISWLTSHIHLILNKVDNSNEADFGYFLAEMTEQSKNRIAGISTESEITLQTEHTFFTEISLMRILKHLHQAQQLERSLR
ncbi:MAG: FUSC family protein [Sneathiella sp.]|uniref:FUSC family protein n=1 Tax=Sneathiella sp. TaxID=1964365 RepID=UPI0030030856